MAEDPVDNDPEYEGETEDDENVGLEDVVIVPPDEVPPDQGDAGEAGAFTGDDR